MRDLAVELLGIICKELAEDKETCLILCRVSRLFFDLAWPLVSPELEIKGRRDLRDFVALLSAPAIPLPLKCTSLVLKNAADICQAPEDAQN